MPERHGYSQDPTQLPKQKLNSGPRMFLQGTKENYVLYLLALREYLATMPAEAIPAIHSLREIGGAQVAAGAVAIISHGTSRPLFRMRWWEVLLVIFVLVAWAGLGYLVYSQNQRLGLCQTELRALRKNLSPLAKCGS